MRYLQLLCHCRRLREDERGNIGMMMGLLAVPLIGAAGLGLDYTRSTTYRMQLDQAAAAASLAAVDTARALLAVDPNMPQAEVVEAAKARMTKVFAARVPQSADVDGVKASSTVNRVGETISASVTYQAQIKTTFSALLGVQNVAIDGSGKSNGVYTPPPPPADDPNVLIKENFDKGIGELEHGTWGYRSNYNNWLTSHKGIEIIKASAHFPAPPNGATYVAELDAMGNTSMSKKVYLPVGNYELRYFIRDRIAVNEYNPVWMCGSKSADLASTANETNRLAVYLDIATNDTPPASFAETTNNLIDVCVSTGQKWIERSVKITMNQPSFYWLTFKAEGANDGYGSVLSGIRFCKNTCAGTPAPSFPWTAMQTLFTDGFETPVGTMDRNQTTLDASGVNSGWPLLPSGWTTSEMNQIDFTDMGWVSGPEGGTYVVELDAGGNRAINRRMIFSPGFYRLTYNYATVHYLGQNGGPICGLTDIEGQKAQAALYLGSALSDTARMSVYIDADLNVSHPETQPTYNAPAVWKNPNGSAATLPRLPVNAVDGCMFSKGVARRTVNFRISKPGYYWLTFRGEGKDDYQGPVIDVVKVVALGDLSSTPPSGVVSVPYPGLAPGSPIVMKGLQIAAQ